MKYKSSQIKIVSSSRGEWDSTLITVTIITSSIIIFGPRKNHVPNSLSGISSRVTDTFQALEQSL